MARSVDIRSDHLKIVQDILRTHLSDDVKVWVFGSRATWTTKDSSDLDLAVEGDMPLDFSTISVLQDAFEDSSLPYAVDVIDMNRISGSFRQIVEAHKILLSVPESILEMETYGRNQQAQKNKHNIYEQQNKKVDQPSIAKASWKAVGEFSPFVYGKGLPKDKRNFLGEFPVFGSNGVIGFHDVPLTSGPTVIIGRKGTVGAVHYSPVPCWPIDTTFFVAGGNPSLQRYKYYALKSLGFENMNADSAVPGLNRDEAHAQEIYVPHLPEQFAIAHILGTLDDKIELNQKTNKTLEEIAKVIFKSWFVDFDPVRAKAEGRPTGLPPEISDLFPSELVDSEIGEIPKRWEIQPISNLADCVGGATPSTKNPDFWESGTIMWATPKDLSNSSSVHLSRTSRKITELGLSKISSGLLPVGTVLLSSRAPVGYLAITVEPTAVNQGFIALKPVEGISGYYLFNWCGANLEKIKNRASGTTFAEISKKSFRPIPALRPLDQLMSHFHSLVSPIYEKLLTNDKESQVLVSIRDALLPKLISGELRIPDAEKFLEKAGI